MTAAGLGGTAASVIPPRLLGSGHTKISGKTVLVRGLNARAAVVSTP